MFVEYPRPKGASKLSATWYGPWRVVGRKDDGTPAGSDSVYVVRDEHGDVDHDVHVRRMRPCNSTRLAEWEQFWNEKRGSADYDYPVRAIVGHVPGAKGSLRLGTGKDCVQFEVAWEGYPDDYNSLLYYNDIAADDFMTAYLRSVDLRVKGNRLVPV